MTYNLKRIAELEDQYRLLQNNLARWGTAVSPAEGSVKLLHQQMNQIAIDIEKLRS